MYVALVLGLSFLVLANMAGFPQVLPVDGCMFGGDGGSRAWLL